MERMFSKTILDKGRLPPIQDKFTDTLDWISNMQSHHLSSFQPLHQTCHQR